MRFMKWESQWVLPMNHCEIIIIQHQLGLHMIQSNIPFKELAEYGEYAHSIRNPIGLICHFLYNYQFMKHKTMF